MDDKRYWFPAKRYGWGWGFPTAWQGWLVLAAYVAALTAAALGFPPDHRPVAFFACVIVATMLLLVVCRLKGEPPAWRWGGRG